MQKRSTTMQNRRGQAIVEFAIGLIFFMVFFLIAVGFLNLAVMQSVAEDIAQYTARSVMTESDVKKAYDKAVHAAQQYIQEIYGGAYDVKPACGPGYSVGCVPLMEKKQGLVLVGLRNSEVQQYGVRFPVWSVTIYQNVDSPLVSGRVFQIPIRITKSATVKIEQEARID